jgi:hypothetical protein
MKIKKPGVYSQAGDVQIHVEQNQIDSNLILKDIFILRKTKNGWKIIDSTYLDDGDFPPEGSYNDEK